MALYQLAVLSCRILALYSLVLAIQDMAGLLGLVIATPGLGNYPTPPRLTMGALPLILQSIVAFLLWRLAPAIGRRMVHGLAEPEDEAPLSSSWVAGLVFSLAGVIIIGMALPSLIQRAVEYWMALGFDQTIWNRRIALLAPPLIQLGLGVWLVLIPDGLVRLLQWRFVEDIDDDETVGGDEESSD